MRTRGRCDGKIPFGAVAVTTAFLLLAVTLFADGGAAPYPASPCNGRTTVAGPELESFYVGTLHLGFAAARISCFPGDSVLPQYLVEMVQKDLATARDGSIAICPCVSMDPAEFDRVANALPGRTAAEAGSWVTTLYQRYQQAIRASRCSCLGGAGSPPPLPPPRPATNASCDQCAAERCPSCAGVVILMCEVMDGHPNSQACRDCMRQNCSGGTTPPPPQGNESQTLVIPNTQAQKLRTSFATVPGGIYRIQASGVINDWGNAPDGIDAVWCYAEWRCGKEGQAWNQLRINDKGMPDIAGQPIPYNPGHTYTVDMAGDGKPIEFYCSDAQGSSGDNLGAFTVMVTRVR